jgi:DNA (cytosine-5)-methyltransferase 1
LVEGDINRHFNSIPENATLLIGGAPCQSWSLMGNRKGADDKRGELFFKTVDALSIKKPRFFLFENVKGLLSHDNGKSFANLLDRITQAGYEYHFQLFNMSEYGIHQRRERVIIWGKRIGEAINLESLVPPKANFGALVLEDLLSQIHDTLPNSEVTQGGSKVGAFGKILRPGENLKNVAEIELKRRFAQAGITNPPQKIMGHRPVYRLNPFLVAPTMVYNNGTNVPWHPWKDRRLTVREAATIQGFPLTFEFMGKLQEQYKQVANAVPPKFSEQLANQFIKQLKGEYL